MTAKTYLTCPVTGRIVCLEERGCAGMTLQADYRNNSDGPVWFGHDGAAYVRLTLEDAAEVLAITGGPLCDCEAY